MLAHLHESHCGTCLESASLYKSSYIAMIIFDALIFVMAVAKMGRMYRTKQLCTSHSSMVSILLRDGMLPTTVYKGVYICFIDMLLKVPCYTRMEQIVRRSAAISKMNDFRILAISNITNFVVLLVRLTINIRNFDEQANHLSIVLFLQRW